MQVSSAFAESSWWASCIDSSCQLHCNCYGESEWHSTCEMQIGLQVRPLEEICSRRDLLRSFWEWKKERGDQKIALEDSWRAILRSLSSWPTYLGFKSLVFVNRVVHNRIFVFVRAVYTKCLTTLQAWRISADDERSNEDAEGLHLAGVSMKALRLRDVLESLSFLSLSFSHSFWLVHLTAALWVIRHGAIRLQIRILFKSFSFDLPIWGI